MLQCVGFTSLKDWLQYLNVFDMFLGEQGGCIWLGIFQSVKLRLKHKNTLDTVTGDSYWYLRGGDRRAMLEGMRRISLAYLVVSCMCAVFGRISSGFFQDIPLSNGSISKSQFFFKDEASKSWMEETMILSKSPPGNDHISPFESYLLT